MKYRYKTNNTCSKEIVFDVEDNKIYNVQFLGGGCPGNLQAVPKLVDGMTREEVIKRLEGIICGFRGTSCANELATAVKESLFDKNCK